MGYRLGVDLGTTFTSAAVLASGTGWPAMVGLGNRAMQIPSVLFLKPDGEFLVGEAAERRGATQPDRVAREFKRRLGDQVPILIAGQPHSAQALQAVLLAWVVDQVTQRQGGPPDHITLTHPASWGPYKHDLFRQTIALANITNAQVITEPEAVAVLYAARNTLYDGDTIAVYDLGGGTFDAAVLAKTSTGFQALGTPEGIEQLGGIDFDEALFRHAISSLGDQLKTLLADPHVSGHNSGLARLRRDCVEAKEGLSTDTETTVPIVLPGLTTTLTLTRHELEAMIGPTITDTITATQRAIRSAGLQPDDLTAIVLSGGSSRVPLVSELLTRTFGRPLALDTHPKHDVALGATLTPVTPLVAGSTTTPAKRPSRRQRAIAPPPPVTPTGPSGSAREPLVNRDTERAPRPTPFTVPRRAWLTGFGALVVAAVSVVLVLMIQSRSSDPDPAESRSTSGTPGPSGPQDGRDGAALPPTMLVLAGVVGQVFTMYTVDAESGQAQAIQLFHQAAGGAHPFLPTISRDRESFIYLVGPSQADPGVPWVHPFAGETRPLFTEESPCGVSYRPAFSPAGDEIAVVCLSRSTGSPGLYVIRQDGSLIRKLPTRGVPTGGPTWTDDGRLIYMRESTHGHDQLWSIEPGVPQPQSTLRQLTDGSAWDSSPDWSRKHGLLFLRSPAKGEPGSVFLLGVDGSERITSSDEALAPAWSPRGDAIAYVVRTDATARLDVMSWKGVPHPLLLPDDAAAGAPAWGSR